MAGSAHVARKGAHLSAEALDVLFPLHLRLDDAGRVADAGPATLRILGADLTGRVFFDVFAVVKPRAVTGIDSLRAKAGRNFYLSATASDGAAIQFRAVIEPLDAGSGLLIDLSIGSNMADAIARFALTSKDFKPNDFSIDLFYTFETQKTLLEDSRKLTDALMEAKQDAERRASIDTLTGIANRAGLHERLTELLAATGNDKLHAFLHIDLDKFKSINDTYGHIAGDQVLKETANALRDFSREEDYPVRIGGDEFALVLCNIAEDMDLEDFAEQLIARIIRPIRLGDTLFQVGASIGFLTFRAGDLPSPDRLMMNSDIALYEAKETGERVKVLTPEMVRRHDERAELIARIETGLDASEFEPFFQPLIDITTNQIYGIEVLARWRRPGKGYLPPSEFLEPATHANLMSRIDLQVIAKAVQAFSQWGDSKPVGKLSINLSQANLRSLEFNETIIDELLSARVPVASVQIELLESILFDDGDDLLRERCRHLRDVGFTLALDDFGTGHASIATIIEAPISVLKIDRSFVTGLDRNEKLYRITQSILSMGAHIGLDVVSEGVETEGELAAIRAAGGKYVQGYFFAPPRSEEDFSGWIDEWYGQRQARTQVNRY